MDDIADDATKHGSFLRRLVPSFYKKASSSFSSQTFALDGSFRGVRIQWWWLVCFQIHFLFCQLVVSLFNWSRFFSAYTRTHSLSEYFDSWATVATCCGRFSISLWILPDSSFHQIEWLRNESHFIYLLLRYGVIFYSLFFVSFAFQAKCPCMKDLQHLYWRSCW